MLEIKKIELSKHQIDIQIDELQVFRSKFPVWKDADNFECL